MSLLVDLSIQAASIVDAAWDRAIANRERLRRRIDVQATREQVERDQARTLPWEQLYTTPSPLNYKPDEPVAYPGTKPSIAGLLASAGVFFFKAGIPAVESITDVQVDTFYLWSGDGQSHASIPLGPFSGAVIALPLSSKSAIAVVQWETGETFCFYVDRISVRVVPTPSAASGIDFSRDARNLGFTPLQTPETEPQWMNGTFNDAASFFLSPDLFPDFPSGVLVSYEYARSLVPGIGPDQPFSLYSNFASEFDGSNDGSFIARINSSAYRWTGPDPSTVTPDENWNVPFSDSRWEAVTVTPYSSSTPIIPGAKPSGVSLEMLYYWDWNQPAYCRGHLLALGFAPEDLEP